MQLLFDKERGDVSPGETCSSEAKRNRTVNLASFGKFLTLLQFVWNGSNSDSNLSSAARLQLFAALRIGTSSPLLGLKLSEDQN